jgi:hypothetical protein
VTIFSYVIEHDLGFAPNPFHRVCTLACCKPLIRKAAKVGDYILGTGASRPKLRGHLIYWMRVNEIVTFDQYWNDERFRRKKPDMTGATYQRYGDNIYHRKSEGAFVQIDSFHSFVGGGQAHANIARDTGRTDRVLIGNEFAYWGRSAPKIPTALRFLVVPRQGHWRNFSAKEVAQAMAWIKSLPGRGYIDAPADWQFLGTPKGSFKARKK